MNRKPQETESKLPLDGQPSFWRIKGRNPNPALWEPEVWGGRSGVGAGHGLSVPVQSLPAAALGKEQEAGGRGGLESCGLYIMKVLTMGFIPHLPVFNSVELSVLRGSEHWFWLRASLEGQITAGGCHRHWYYLTKTRSSQASFPGWSGRASKPSIGTTHGLGQPPPFFCLPESPYQEHAGWCMCLWGSSGILPEVKLKVYINHRIVGNFSKNSTRSLPTVGTGTSWLKLAFSKDWRRPP